MAVTASGTLCATHSGTLAVAGCDRCGKPVCAICRLEDVSADAVYCSSSCRDVERGEPAGLPRISDADLAEGYARPIVVGWKLWVRTLPQLLLYTAPLAVLMGLIVGMIPDAEPESVEPDLMRDLILVFAFLAVLGYGVALIQVILSQRYTGFVRGNPFLWTLRRFLPWAAASAIAVAATLLGYLLFVVPGIILALRLFWADEYALVHEAGPLRALKESWELTQGEMGKIFIFQAIAGLAAFVPVLVVGLGIAALLAAIGEPQGKAGLVENSLLFFFLWNIYGAMHAPELVYFYGMRATRAVPIVAQGKVLGI